MRAGYIAIHIFTDYLNRETFHWFRIRVAFDSVDHSYDMPLVYIQKNNFRPAPELMIGKK